MVDFAFCVGQNPKPSSRTANFISRKKRRLSRTRAERCGAVAEAASRRPAARPAGTTMTSTQSASTTVRWIIGRHACIKRIPSGCAFSPTAADIICCGPFPVLSSPPPQTSRSASHHATQEGSHRCPRTPSTAPAIDPLAGTDRPVLPPAHLATFDNSPAPPLSPTHRPALVHGLWQLHDGAATGAAAASFGSARRPS